MPETIQQPALQQRTLHLYGELLCRADHWGGKLAIAAFPGAASSGLAAAASIAGAASLTVDDDATAMKAHFRDGAFDFLVKSLDEAIRALKNEVRQSKPIAIGLVAPLESTLAEINERGLTADFVLQVSSHQSPAYLAWLNAHTWQPTCVPRETAQMLAATDPIRERWVRNLATHQRSARSGDIYVWLNAAR